MVNTTQRLSVWGSLSQLNDKVMLIFKKGTKQEYYWTSFGYNGQRELECTGKNQIDALQICKYIKIGICPYKITGIYLSEVRKEN